MRLPFALAMLLTVLVTPRAVLAQSAASRRAKTEPDPTRYAKYLARAQKRETMSKYGAAARSYRQAIMFAPSNRERAQLLLKEANCEFLSEDWGSSHKAYARLLRDYPLYAPQEHVMERLQALATMYEEGEVALLGFSDRETAIDIYELMLQEVPLSKNAIPDYLKLAKLQTAESRHPEAIATLRQVLRYYRSGAGLEEAHLLLCSLLVKEAQTGDGDGRMIRQARREIARFRSRYREKSAHLREAMALQMEADEIQAGKLYELGQFYVRPAHRRLPAARRYLHDVARHYPHTKGGADARKLLAKVWGDTEILPSTEQIDGILAPGIPAPLAKPRIVIPPKKFVPLAERENVKKWLIPLGDINDLDRDDESGVKHDEKK